MVRLFRATYRPLVVVLVLAFVALYAVPLVSAAPAAVITIDHFDAVQGPLAATLGSPVSGSVSGINVLGSERDVRVTVITGSPGSASMQAINSNLLHSQDTGIIAQTLLQWDGNDGTIALNNTGLGGVDLTQAGTQNGLALTVILNDLPIDLKFTIYSGANASTATISLPGGLTGGMTPISYYVPYGAFAVSAGSGANFASVGAIELLIDGKTDASDLTIHDIRTVDLDWGDLPDSYGTTYAANGARHVLGALRLGSLIDPTEINGIPTANALGDDQNGVDDEDGVVTTPNVNWQRRNNGGSVNVTVTGGAGCLSAWMDWSKDGDMLDTAENILNNVAVNAGTTTLTFGVPVEPSAGPYYARFRLYPQDAGGGCTSAKTPTGSANDGEVEDYQWTFTPTAVNLSAFSGSAASEPLTSAMPLAGGVVVSLGVVLLAVRRALRG